MYSLFSDISTLTNISPEVLESVLSKCYSIISHDVAEASIENNTCVKIDVGIGTLVLTNTNENVIYRFEPSEKLQEIVIKAFDTKNSDLTLKVDDTIGKRIKSIYKDLF